jgi:hypothetical protein
MYLYVNVCMLLLLKNLATYLDQKGGTLEYRVSQETKCHPHTISDKKQPELPNHSPKLAAVATNSHLFALRLHCRPPHRLNVCMFV